MTLTLEPTPHEMDILCRESKRRNISVEELVPRLLVEAILERDYPDHQPNEETIAAMKEIDSGGGTHVKDVADMWRECGV